MLWKLLRKTQTDMKGKTVVKKTISLLLIAALALLSAFSLAACGNSAEGITIAIPNDTTNEARALLLLAENGVIKLTEGVGIKATKKDIIENPKNIEINEMEAALLPSVLDEVTCAVINGNYAIAAGLKIADAIAVENSESVAIKQEYVNILVVKEGNEDLPKIKALKEVLTSDEIAKYITDNYDGPVVPMK